MDELLLTVGFLLQVFYLILFIIYIRNRRAKKRFKEESLNLDESVVEVTPVLETEELYGTTYRGWREYDLGMGVFWKRRKTLFPRRR